MSSFIIKNESTAALASMLDRVANAARCWGGAWVLWYNRPRPRKAV